MPCNDIHTTEWGKFSCKLTHGHEGDHKDGWKEWPRAPVVAWKFDAVTKKYYTSVLDGVEVQKFKLEKVKL